MTALSSAQTKSGRLASCLHVRQTADFWMYEANASTEMKPVRAESRLALRREGALRSPQARWGLQRVEHRMNVNGEIELEQRGKERCEGKKQRKKKADHTTDLKRGYRTCRKW